MSRYSFDAPAVEYGPYHTAVGAPGARFGWQSRASELWLQAGLVAAGVGVGAFVGLCVLVAGVRWGWRVAALGTLILALPNIAALLAALMRPTGVEQDDDDTHWPLWIPIAGAAILALPALPVAWPWWSPIMGGLAAGGLAFGVAAVWVVVDDRRLLWFIAPPSPEPPVQPVPVIDTRLVYTNTGPRLTGKPELPLPDGIPSPAEREQARYLANLRAYVIHVYSTGDASWRTAERLTLPSGDRISRNDWQQWCDLLVRAGLARRPYDRAALQITSTYADARRALRELLVEPGEPLPLESNRALTGETGAARAV